MSLRRKKSKNRHVIITGSIADATNIQANKRVLEHEGCIVKVFWDEMWREFSEMLTEEYVAFQPAEEIKVGSGWREFWRAYELFDEEELYS